MDPREPADALLLFVPLPAEAADLRLPDRDLVGVRPLGLPPFGEGDLALGFMVFFFSGCCFMYASQSFCL